MIIQNRQKKGPGGIIGWLIRRKIVSTPGQANAILVVFIIVGMGAIIYFNIQTFSN